jgi:UDP-N-acetyl-D-mannosaminuronate dehydrogenase
VGSFFKRFRWDLVLAISHLSALGAQLKVYDPYYIGEKLPNFDVCSSIDEVLDKTKAIVILTDHREFLNLSFDQIASKLGKLIVVDLRNIYETNRFPKGTIYCGVGRALREI